LRKRITTALLALMMLLSVLAFPAGAATNSEETALRQKITKTYKRLRASNGYDSYNGYCGKMAAYTLYHLGIDKQVHSHNGKDEYDAYENLKKTTGGYAVKTYPSPEYNLEEALNAISEGGTKDVYNILLGFHRTNTTAGRKYGHALVVYGILNGNVYFTESFSTALGGKEGTPTVCSIQKFADYYNKWTTFEGAIYFGTKSYADFCTYYPADLFVQTTEETTVYTIPSNVDVDGYTAKKTGTIRANERVEVSGLYKNSLGKLFYEICYGGVAGYVAAETLQLVRVNTHKINAVGFNAPETLRKGENFSIAGTVSLKQDGLSNLRFSILDQDGNEKYSYLLEKDGTMATVSKAASNAMKFSKLDNGIYTYKVTCDVENFYVSEGVVTEGTTTVTLVEKLFTVGSATLPQEQAPAPDDGEVLNGWHFDTADRLWKYYADGVLASGWIFAEDADYYILEDGTAATGCVEINGENRYFTESGAMCTGWYETAEGKIYLLSNGTMAKGWYRVQGTPCYFGEDGIWNPDAQYAPSDLPELDAHTDHMFTTVFENLSKFTEMYQDFFG